MKYNILRKVKLSMKVEVSILCFEAPGQSALEWAVDINGALWASGDCATPEDGERQARAELIKAGFTEAT